MFEFKLPDLGEGIHEGELIKWHVKVGDRVNEDDPLCDLETDKATVAIPSPRSGIIRSLNGTPGETIKVGAVLVVIDENSSKQSDTNKSTPDSKKVNERTEPNEIIASKKVIAAPATRRLAREMGIDINEVTGTSPGGKVTKEDLINFSHDSTMKTEAAGFDSTTEIITDSESDKTIERLKPVTGGIPFFELASLPDFETQGPVKKESIKSLRKKTAVKTTSSMILIPHVAHMDECDVTELEALRKEYNDKNKETEKLTFMVFIIKAIASLLQQYPAFNASIDPEKMEIIYKKFYHIGFAVDTSKGLMVPVVKNANRQNITRLAQKIQNLAQKGREGTITLPEISGGTFTVTNVGVIGGTGIVPTINYPESAILGMGRVSKKPVVRNDHIVIRHILPVTLSFDHRVADGAQAARFVTQLKLMLEDPFVFMKSI